MVGNDEIAAIILASIQDLRIVIHKVFEYVFPFAVYLIMIDVALFISLHEMCCVMHHPIAGLETRHLDIAIA